MSYATSKQNSDNHFNLSDEFLERTSVNLNESLDTREWLLPERRRANIEEADRIRRQIELLVSFRNTSIDDQHDAFFSAWYLLKDKGFNVMQNVLQNDFIAGWKNMNLFECVYGVIELYVRIFRDSLDTNNKDKWPSSIRILLEEKLNASKRALHNLDRVHDAYHNVRPLLNSTVTPNGSFDMIYLTEELFKRSTEINETYTRVRRHIRTYIDNIDGIHEIYSADYHENETVAKCFNYSNAILTASGEYVTDLKLYESLVIQIPLTRILKAKKSVEYNDILISSMKFDLSAVLETISEAKTSLDVYFTDIANSPIVAYFDHLNRTRTLSKLADATRIVYQNLSPIDMYEMYLYQVKELSDNQITYMSLISTFYDKKMITLLRLYLTL